MDGQIFDIKRFAIHDGPGIRTTVFFKGCPLRCIWCHNPEGLSPGRDIWVKHERCIRCKTCIGLCAEGALHVSGGKLEIDRKKCSFCGKCIKACPACAIIRLDRTVSDDTLAEELMLDKLFADISGGGVTLSGGEPLMQADFALSVLQKLKAARMDTCVETSLMAPPDVVERLVPLVDHFLVDIKLMDETLHEKYTGVPLGPILNNFRHLAAHAKDLLVRVPLVPGITATQDNLLSIADFVYGCNPRLAIELLNFNSLAGSKYRLLDKKFYDDSVRAFSPEAFAALQELVDKRMRKGG